MGEPIKFADFLNNTAACQLVQLGVEPRGWAWGGGGGECERESSGTGVSVYLCTIVVTDILGYGHILLALTS